MNLYQEGYVLMTVCGRFLGEKNGIYVFITDPFAAKFFENSKDARDELKKAYDTWGESLYIIPTERKITLLG